MLVSLSPTVQPSSVSSQWHVSSSVSRCASRSDGCPLMKGSASAMATAALAPALCPWKPGGARRGYR